MMENQLKLIKILIIAIILIFFIGCLSSMAQLSYNTIKHNETLTFEELKCKNFCKPDKYIYQSGNIFKQTLCKCEGEN